MTAPQPKPPIPAALLDHMRRISPALNLASRLWRKGGPVEAVAYILGVNSEQLPALLAALRADQRIPPTWAFPERPSNWHEDADARDEWVWSVCAFDDMPEGAAARIRARFEGRDHRATMREHQRAQLGDAGRPLTAEQEMKKRLALKDASESALIEAIGQEEAERLFGDEAKP